MLPGENLSFYVIQGCIGGHFRSFKVNYDTQVGPTPYSNLYCSWNFFFGGGVEARKFGVEASPPDRTLSIFLEIQLLNKHALMSVNSIFEVFGSFSATFFPI